MTLRPPLLVLAAAGLLAATLPACNAPAPGATGNPLPGGGTPASAATAGVATGMAVDAQGKPLADVQVDLSGPSTAAGKTNFYYPKTDAAGKYRQADVTPGVYLVNAWRAVTYNGRDYKLPLAPTTGLYTDPLPSQAGIVRDFVFKIRGAKAGSKATDGYGAYYGGTAVYWAADFASNALELPEGGTNIHVKLVPDGPLMDGTAGEAINESFPFKKSGYQHVGKNDDVPLGRYTASAEARLADGSTKALRVATKATMTDADYQATATLEFLPNGGSNLRPYQERPTEKANLYMKL